MGLKRKHVVHWHPGKQPACTWRETTQPSKDRACFPHTHKPNLAYNPHHKEIKGEREHGVGLNSYVSTTLHDRRQPKSLPVSNFWYSMPDRQQRHRMLRRHMRNARMPCSTRGLRQWCQSGVNPGETGKWPHQTTRLSASTSLHPKKSFWMQYRAGGEAVNVAESACGGG